MGKAKAYLVDTGVFLRWFVPQDGFKHARRIRDEFIAGQLSLQTVASVRSELGHVLRNKGLLPGLLDREQYVTATRAIDDLGVTIRALDADALERAARLASNHMLRFFDALVVDGALESGLPLLTSDAALCRAVGNLIPTEILDL